MAHNVINPEVGQSFEAGADEDLTVSLKETQTNYRGEELEMERNLYSQLEHGDKSRPSFAASQSIPVKMDSNVISEPVAADHFDPPLPQDNYDSDYDYREVRTNEYRIIDGIELIKSKDYWDINQHVQNLVQSVSKLKEEVVKKRMKKFLQKMKKIDL